MKKTQKIISMLLAVALISCVLGSAQDVHAKSGLSRPKLGKWKVTYDGELDPDKLHRTTGMGYSITWKKVKGADGYQTAVCAKGYTAPSLKHWSTPQYITTLGTHRDVGHSMYTEIRIKVRAYKLLKKGEDIKALYGPWSKWKATRTKFYGLQY